MQGGWNPRAAVGLQIAGPALLSLLVTLRDPPCPPTHRIDHLHHHHEPMQPCALCAASARTVVLNHGLSLGAMLGYARDITQQTAWFRVYHNTHGNRRLGQPSVATAVLHASGAFPAHCCRVICTPQACRLGLTHPDPNTLNPSHVAYMRMYCGKRKRQYVLYSTYMAIVRL